MCLICFKLTDLMKQMHKLIKSIDQKFFYNVIDLIDEMENDNIRFRLKDPNKVNTRYYSLEVFVTDFGLFSPMDFYK